MKKKHHDIGKDVHMDPAFRGQHISEDKDVHTDDTPDKNMFQQPAELSDIQDVNAAESRDDEDAES